MKVFARAFLCGKELDPEDTRRKATTAGTESFVQTISGDAATNEFFLEMLAAQTLHAEASGSLLARRAEVDFLLRLAGTTQISKAIREKGATRGEPFILVVAGGTRTKAPKGLPRARLTRLPTRDPSKEELERVEKAALLSVGRS